MNEQSAAELLRLLNQISESFQSTMTEDERAALDAKHAGEQEGAVYAAASREEAMIQFTADALETLAGDIHSTIDRRLESVYRQALEVYYATEELARQPEHAHLAEQLEAMRQAHERDYGFPPPPREGAGEVP